MNATRVQRLLLTTLCVTYFLAPTTLPWVGWSPHGLILLLAGFWYVATDLRRFALRRSWPFVGLALALAASWISARGDADIGIVRAVGFGAFTAFLISEYLPGTYGVRLLVVLSFIVAAVSVFMSGLFAAALSGLSVTGFDPFAALFGQSSYHSALFGVVAVPVVALLGTRPGHQYFLLMLFPLWMVIVLGGLRGMWVGAAVALFAFLIVSRRPWRAPVAVTIAAIAFVLGAVSIQQPLDPRSPNRDGDSVALATAGLAAKATGSTGAAKLYEELTTTGRVGYWLAGLRMWVESPVFGVGPGNFARNSPSYFVHSGVRRDAETEFDAHNMFVSLLAELGVLGFSMLIASIAVPAHRWYRCLRNDPQRRDALALGGAIFAGLTAVGLTWDIHMQRMWWISLGLFSAVTLPDSDPAAMQSKSGNDG